MLGLVSIKKEKEIMWNIFKDWNEYNEKAIIGFISFAIMVMFGVVDLVTGLMGQDLVINDNVYNSFVWVTLGSFGIAGAEKVYKKWEDPYSMIVIESQMARKKLDKVIARIPKEAQRFLKNTIRKNIEDRANE